MKQHTYDRTQSEHIDYPLGLLDSLPLPAHYKAKHLLDNFADLPIADLPNYIPNCVRCPEPVSLNAINIETTFMPSADILPWHSDNDDPSYRYRECRFKKMQVDTMKFTSDIYPDPVFEDKVFEDFVFASDGIDILDYDMPTKVNLLDTGIMRDYWSHDPDNLIVNTIEIDKDDHTAVRGQFDSGADATVINLLIYLHNYKQYNAKFK